MHIRNSFGAAGAAMVGIMALLGANAANAVISLDGADTGGVTYAQETITSSSEGEDGTTYYLVDGGDGVGDLAVLDVTAMLGFGTVQGASLVVRYDFTGMILTADSLTSAALTISGKEGEPLAGTPSSTLRQGGKANDDYVVFLVTGFMGAVPDTAVLTLALENVAISAGGGSIAMHVSDDLSIPAETMASHSGAVNMASALRPVKMPVDPIALVAEKFLVFGDSTVEGTTTVTLGNVMVGIANTMDDPPLLNAANGEPVESLSSLIAVGEDVVNLLNTDDDSVSIAVFKGDFSFVTRAWLDDVATCTDDASDLRMNLVDEVRDTTRLRSQSLAYLNANSNLCIMVRGKDSPMAIAIPATAPYIVAKTIVLNQDNFSASKFPPAPAPAPLGAIMRNGTTVHIPYITQFASYNQRIVIVNRGVEADYTFSFMTEDGVTTTRGADAEGTLAANSTTYLSLMFGDVLTIEGPFNRASATLIVESEPTYIDVVVSQTNANGGTDTVLYTSN